MTTGKPLEGKVALVTGASRGIGLAIARSLARMGAKVALCARDPKRLESAASRPERKRVQAFVAVPADVSRANEIASLVRRNGAIARPDRNPRQ